jgi:hypothetical protein
VGDSNAPEQVDATASQTVKFSSQLSVVAKATHTSGPFANTGPIPPKAEKETAYTIYLTANNSSNVIKNTTVSAQLPGYVRWLSKVSPSTEDVTFDKTSGMVVWNIGDLRPTGSAGRTVAFQVALLPSVSQVGASPELAKTITLTAEDQYTGAKLQATGNSVTTITGDVGAQSNDGTVTP